MTEAPPAVDASSGTLRGARLADPTFEAAYRAARLPEDARGAMFFTLVVGLAPLLFIANDLAFLGSGPRFRLLTALRIGWALASIGLAVAQRRASSAPRLDALASAAALGSILLFTFLNMQRPRTFLLHAAVDVAVANALWTMLPVPFALQGALALLYTALEAVIVVGWRDATPAAFASIGLSFLLVNTIGAATGRRLQVSRRREWLALRHEREGREALVAAHRAAQEASRAKSAFLAGVSHEILTPLNPILGFSELLLARRNDPADREALQAIAASGRVLHGLITDVLDLAAGEAAETRVEAGPCHVGEVLDEVVQVMEPRAAEKGLALVLDAPSRPPAVLVDGARLRQVLLNLVSNAIRHTPSGSVTLSLEAKATAAGARDLLLRVWDTGPGVAPSEREAIFEPFRRGGGFAAVPGQGFGIGLALSRRLVERMGGALVLADRDGAAGATFEVRLPSLRLAPAGAADGPAAPAAGVMAARGTILIVDDEPTNRALLQAYLRGQPVEVREAASGEEAIGALEACPPDVVLLDLAMPGLDGQAVRRWADERAGLSRVRFIAVTAHARREEVPERFDAWLAKPVSRAALLATLAGLLPAVGRGDAGAPVAGDGPDARAGALPDAELVALRAAAAELASVPLAAPARELAERAERLAVAHGAPALQRWAADLRAGADALDAGRVRATLAELDAVLQPGP